MLFCNFIAPLNPEICWSRINRLPEQSQGTEEKNKVLHTAYHARDGFHRDIIIGSRTPPWISSYFIHTAMSSSPTSLSLQTHALVSPWKQWIELHLYPGDHRPNLVNNIGVDGNCEGGGGQNRPWILRTLIYEGINLGRWGRLVWICPWYAYSLPSILTQFFLICPPPFTI